MSLKAFHLFFIALSVLVCIGFGAWAIARYAATNGGEYLVVAPASFITAAALAWYGVMFVRKMKHLPMLALLLALVPSDAFACPVCFGDPNSLLSQGVSKGVLALLGVTVVVLVAFASFFIFLIRRVRAAEATTDPSTADSAAPAGSPAA